MRVVSIAISTTVLETRVEYLPNTYSPFDGLVDDGETLSKYLLVELALSQAVGALSELLIRCLRQVNTSDGRYEILVRTVVALEHSRPRAEGPRSIAGSIVCDRCVGHGGRLLALQDVPIEPMMRRKSGLSSGSEMR